MLNTVKTRVLRGVVETELRCFCDGQIEHGFHTSPLSEACQRPNTIVLASAVCLVTFCMHFPCARWTWDLYTRKPLCLATRPFHLYHADFKPRTSCSAHCHCFSPEMASFRRYCRSDARIRLTVASEVLTAASIKNTFIWDVTCSLVLVCPLP
jgi:hypothetical protein